MDLKRQNYLIVFGQFLTKMATVGCCARWDFSSLSRKRLLRAWSFETLIPAAATVYSSSRHSGFIWFLLRSFKLVDISNRSDKQWKHNNPMIKKIIFTRPKGTFDWLKLCCRSFQFFVAKCLTNLTTFLTGGYSVPVSKD